MKMSAAHPQVQQSVQRETAEKGESVQDSRKTMKLLHLTIPHLKHLHIINSRKPFHTDLLFHIVCVNLLYNP